MAETFIQLPGGGPKDAARVRTTAAGDLVYSQDVVVVDADAGVPLLTLAGQQLYGAAASGAGTWAGMSGAAPHEREGQWDLTSIEHQ